MIYATVLDNGVLMTAYLKSRGVSEVVLGCSRGFGALLGLGGTVVYPWIRQHCDQRAHNSVNAIKTSGRAVALAGVISIWCQWLVLAPLVVVLIVQWACGVSLTIPWAHAELLPCALVVCVVLSRPWLWCFDLSISQLLQEFVVEGERATVAAVQGAVCQLFSVIIIVQGIFWSNPTDFVVLLVLSLVVVLTAACIFSKWCFVMRAPSL